MDFAVNAPSPHNTAHRVFANKIHNIRKETRLYIQQRILSTHAGPAPPLETNRLLNQAFSSAAAGLRKYMS